MKRRAPKHYVSSTLTDDGELKELCFLRPTYPLILRLIPLLGSLSFVVLGLSIIIMSSIGIVDYVAARSVGLNLLVVVLIGLVFTGLGGLGVSVFLIPAQVLVLKKESRRANLVFHYPLGMRRQWDFDLTAIGPVEVFWNTDSDAINGGNWSLDIRLPDEQTYKQFAGPMSVQEQKHTLEKWRDEIGRLIGGTA